MVKLLKAQPPKLLPAKKIGLPHHPLSRNSIQNRTKKLDTSTPMTSHLSQFANWGNIDKSINFDDFKSLPRVTVKKIEDSYYFLQKRLSIISCI